MLFQKKVDRVFDQLKEKSAGENPSQAEKFDPRKAMEKPPLSALMEKGDFLAMILSALLVLIPIALVVLLVMVGLPRLFFRM